MVPRLYGAVICLSFCELNRGGRTAKGAAHFSLSRKIRPMFSYLLVIHAVIAAALVGVILMQRSEGGGFTGGGSPAGLMSARGAADFLTRTTAILATLFVAMSITMAAVAGLSRKSGGLDESLKRTEAPAAVTGPQTNQGQPVGAAGGQPAGPQAQMTPEQQAALAKQMQQQQLQQRQQDANIEKQRQAFEDQRRQALELQKAQDAARRNAQQKANEAAAAPKPIRIAPTPIKTPPPIVTAPTPDVTPPAAGEDGAPK